MKDKAKDLWPYESVVDALKFFAMSEKDRDEYVVEDFPDVLFHGRGGDFITGDAKDAITTIFAEILCVGCSFDSWIEDEILEEIGIEGDFKDLCYDVSFNGVEAVYGN